MKPRNFPGRVNERRRSAIDRLGAQLVAGVKRRGKRETSLTPNDRDRCGRELTTLTKRMKPATIARAIRTKKDRSGQGKFARSA